MSATFLNLSGVRALPLVRQAEAAECGLACLAMVAGFHGFETDLAALRRRFSISVKGATLKSLIDIAAKVGLGSRALRCELDELKQLRAPAILHWGTNHFVVLKRAGKKQIEIHDPALGPRSVKTEEVSRQFTGVALELSPTAQFERKRERQIVKLSGLMKLSPQTLGALTQGLLLSLVIEALVLTSPFYTQLVIDEAILKGDVDLLGALAIGFALVALFNVAATALRALVLQFLGSVLSFDMQARLFHQLVRLPLDWFHKRQVGDIQSRFRAIQPIKQFVASGALAAVLDGVLGIVTCALMFFYAPVLAGIAVGVIAIYALLRLAMLDVSRRVAGDYLIADAKEQTKFLETLRAAQTIKASGAETAREGLQRNAMAATLNSGLKSGNVQIGYSALNQTLSGLADVVLIYLGAQSVIANDLSVGMLMAFMAYKGQFTSRAMSLIENLIQWSLLDVQLERLGDIALQPRDAHVDAEGYYGEMRGEVEVRSVLFRYGVADPDILRGVSLRVEAGEFVAIVGPSGCGKSTLLKILTGLYAPTFGEVLIDGRPLRTWSASALRSQIVLVAQDDQLLAGSIAENIAFFDERIDMAWVRECARRAAIHDEIERMPMGYQSLVGDMGSSLSGGQKQRVLIARALYRRPRILILDEGTSHLDLETEKAVNAALSDLAITRIVVAHRPETIRAAGRALAIVAGVVAKEN
jgi:ATP-binding cassette, subfamily B, bacterial CvaB/MchF/RaxB